MAGEECELCEFVDDIRGSDDLVDVGTCWTANVRQAPGRPAIVLQVREHRAGLASLEPTEAAELGTSIQVVAAALERAPGVERVYAQTFNEAPGQHVHVHLAPRFQGERDIGPNAAADVVPPAEFDIGAVLGELRELSAAAGPGAHGLPRPVTGGRRGGSGAARSPDLLGAAMAAAETAAEAATTLRKSLDLLMDALEVVQPAVDEQRASDLVRVRSEVSQAGGLTTRFRRLHVALPEAVAALKPVNSLHVVLVRLGKFIDDFAEVHDHEAGIDAHLDEVEWRMDRFWSGDQPSARDWRALRDQGPAHLRKARLSLRELSDGSVKVLSALGREVERVRLSPLS